MSATGTKQRILDTSLALFNRYGEPNVSTNHIADEMDISPGNLYYHYRNKDEIIFQLFKGFESDINALLEPPTGRMADMEDMWLYLHLVFEAIWRYRFLYRDLHTLVQRNKILHKHMRRIIARKIRTAVVIFEGLADAGLMHADREDMEALARNLAVVATYWLNFATISDEATEDEAQHLAMGAYQVLSMVTPYLAGDARALLHKLRGVYLAG